MPQSAVSPQTRSARNLVWQHCLWIAAAYALILLVTRSASLGDTAEYAGAIAGRLGKSPLGAADTLWESGHLIWRPLGWLFLTIFSPLLSRATDWTPYMQAAFVLIVISWLSSVANVVLWYAILLDLMKSTKAAFLTALALACAHGVLLYAHSGCSYVPGLTCLSAGFFLIRRRKYIPAALFYAVATVLWLPYVLAGLGLVALLVAPDDWDTPVRESLRAVPFARVIRFVLIFAAVTIFIYALGGAARGIHSAGEAKLWFADASHGWSQSLRAVRLVTGLPRSMLYLGKDGLLFKRFLKHDPYAPVSALALFRASLWKLAAFYFFAAALIYGVWRHSRSAWPMLILIAGAGPVVFFAVFLFEPSAPERYLPAFPFIVAATGYVMRGFIGTMLSGFLAVVMLSNGIAFAAPTINGENAASWSRLAQLRSRIGSKGVIVVTTNQDKIGDYLSRSIFGAVNRPQVFKIYDVVEPGTLRILHWQDEFAAEVLHVWQDGGEIWISRRVWSEKPKPEWNWVEGDDPLEIWSQLYSFFQPLHSDANADGVDGFSRLAQDEQNIAYLNPFAAAFKPAAASAAK